MSPADPPDIGSAGRILSQPPPLGKGKTRVERRRVQSVAVRMICDREDEIRKFIPEEYWYVTGHAGGRESATFEARLIKIDEKKAKVSTEAPNRPVSWRN